MIELYDDCNFKRSIKNNLIHNMMSFEGIDIKKSMRINMIKQLSECRKNNPEYTCMLNETTGCIIMLKR